MKSNKTKKSKPTKNATVKKTEEIDDTKLEVRCFYCLERLARYTAGGCDKPRWMHWYKRPQLDTWGTIGYACNALESGTEDLMVQGTKAWTRHTDYLDWRIYEDLVKYHNR